jgi:Domain of unknown function (DUF4307)
VTGQDTLTERYGAPSAWRRRAVIVGSALLAVVFLGWLTWAIWLHSTPKVTSQLESFDVVDDHTATAVVVVTLHDKGVTATCTLQALAEDHSVVGEVTFHPDPAASDQQDHRIITDRRATTVESLGCTAPGQAQPR